MVIDLCLVLILIIYYIIVIVRLKESCYGCIVHIELNFL